MQQSTPRFATGHAESPGLFPIDGLPSDDFPSPGRLAVIMVASVALGVAVAAAVALPLVAAYGALGHAL